MTPNPYFFIVIFIGVALIFPVIPLGLAWLWRRFFQPSKPGMEKNATYECGVESVGDAQIQFGKRRPKPTLQAEARATKRFFNSP